MVNVGGIEFDVGINTTQLRSGLQAAESAIDRLEQKLSGVNAALGQVSASAGQINQLAQAFQTLTGVAQTLGQNFQSIGVATQLLSGNFQQLMAGLVRVEQQLVRTNIALTQINNTQNTTATGILALNTSFQVLAQQLQQANQAQAAASQSIMGLADAYVAAGASMAAMKVSSWVTDWTLLAGRVENLQTVLDNVGQIAGYSVPQLRLFEQQIKQLGITTQASRDALALMAQSQLDLGKSAQLARIAQDAAVIAGKNSSEAFETLTVGIQRTNTWMLRTLGIMVNLQQVFQSYANANGRVVTSLTAVEKQQILLNEVLKKGAQITGTYEAAMGDAYKRFTSMQRLTEEAARTFGDQFQPALAKVVDTTSAALVWFTKLDDKTKALIAGLASATTAFLASAAAIVAVSKALQAFNIAAETAAALQTPLLTLAALLAYAGGTYILFSARARAATEELRKQQEQVAVNVEIASELRQIYVELQAYADVTRLTLKEQYDLNAQIDKAIVLLPNYADALKEARGDLRLFLNVLAESRPDLKVPIDQQLQDLEKLKDATLKSIDDIQRQLDSSQVHNRLNSEADLLKPMTYGQLQNEIEKFTNYSDQAADELGKTISEKINSVLGTSIDLTGTWTRKFVGASNEMAAATTKFGYVLTDQQKAWIDQLEEWKKTYQEILVAQKSLMTAQEQMEFEGLHKLAQESEVSYDLSIRATERYNEARKKLFDDANLEILDQHRKLMVDLEREGFTSMDQVTRFVDLEIKRRKDQFQDVFDKLVTEKGLKQDSEEYQLEEKKLKLQKQSVEVQRGSMIEAIKEQMEYRKEALDNEQKAYDLATKRLERERDITEEVLRRVHGGEDEKSVRAELKAKEAARQSAEIEAEAAKRIEDQRKKLEDIRLEYEHLHRAAVGAPDDKKLAEAEAAKKRELDRAQRHYDEIAEAAQGSAERRKQQEAEFQHEVELARNKAIERHISQLREREREEDTSYNKRLKTAQRSYEEEARIAEKELSKVKQAIIDVQQAFKTTNSFIESKEAELLGKTNPTAGAVASTANQYIKQISQTYDKGQLKKLYDLAKTEIFNQLGPSISTSHQQLDYDQEHSLYSLADNALQKISKAIEAQQVEIARQSNLRQRRDELESELQDIQRKEAQTLEEMSKQNDVVIARLETQIQILSLIAGVRYEPHQKGTETQDKVRQLQDKVDELQQERDDQAAGKAGKRYEPTGFKAPLSQEDLWKQAIKKNPLMWEKIPQDWYIRHVAVPEGEPPFFGAEDLGGTRESDRFRFPNPPIRLPTVRLPPRGTVPVQVEPGYNGSKEQDFWKNKSSSQSLFHQLDRMRENARGLESTLDQFTEQASSIHGEVATLLGKMQDSLKTGLARATNARDQLRTQRDDLTKDLSAYAI